MVDYKKSLLFWIKSMAEMKSVTLYYPKKHVKIKTAKIRSTSVINEIFNKYHEFGKFCTQILTADILLTIKNREVDPSICGGPS